MTQQAQPHVVSVEEWKQALEAVTEAEDALQEQVQAVAAQRRRLPMTEVTTPYTFTGEEGEVSLAEVFGDARQLVVYHFMYAPEWEKGCPHCTEFARDLGPGINGEIIERDTRFVLMSRAPYSALSAWAAEKEIDTPWYSCSREFMEEMEQINDSFGDFPGITVFFRDENGKVYRSYHTTGAAVEAVMPTVGMLRMTPWGMQEKGEDSPEGWPQRFEPLG